MGVKSEISWKQRTESGRREVCVRRVGSEWVFASRERRFDRWEPLERPQFEDWLQLLDAVKRRIARRLLRPEAEQQLRKTIRQAYPEANV